MWYSFQFELKFDFSNIIKGSFFLYLQNFFYIFKIFLNSQNTLWLFKKLTDTTPLKITSGGWLPEVKIYDFRKSKNIWLSKIKIYDFRKSKYITESWLLEVKIYHRKLIFGSQSISLEVDFRKSKYITGNRLSEVKMYHQKSTLGSQNVSSEVKNYFRSWLPGSQKTLPEVDFQKSKN